MKKLLFTLLAVGYAWVLPAQEGLFGMERKDETIHWSIPDSLLGRDLMLTTTVLKAPARTTPDYTKKYGHPGDLFGPIILRFRKVDGEMWVTDPLYDRHLPATSDDPIVNIARLRGDERLYDTLPIVSESDGQTTIDVSRWLKSNQLLGLKPVAFELELGTEDASRTQLKDVKALPHCMLIRKRLTYRPLPFMTPGRKASTSESEWEVGICLSLLPKHPMPVRPSGMPYFGITQQEYQTNPLRASSRSLMKRWRLELTPEDSVRYFQGELVEPIHPIVVYVDRHTPARWLPCIMASIDAWQEAFEQAGFKNAIRAVKEPTDDPNFYNYDNSHAYISWKPSGQSNAYGPTPCLASTGEVKACHIGIFSSVPDLLQLWYFTQCGAADPQAWDVELPQSVMDELMKLVFTHEIGHSLGLEHNFFGSSLHSLDELRDNDFLSRHGMGSSIMDYMRCNYALRPGDRTDLRNRIARIGEYDRWAIEYGYRIFPGKTEEEQERNRQAWLKQTAGELQHRFLGSNDVRAQSEDLGDDHVAFNTQGVENLKYLCSQPAAWDSPDIQSLHVRQRRYQYMITMLTEWTKQVLMHLGGYTQDEAGKGIVWEKANYNRKVIDYLQSYVLTPPEWLFDAQLVNRLELDRTTLARNFYDKMMPWVTDRFADISRAQCAGTEGLLTLEEYVSSLHAALFSEWQQPATPVSDLKFEAQRAYIDQLANYLQRSSNHSSHVLALVTAECARLLQEAEAYAGQTPPGKDRGQALELIEKLQAIAN